jgi:hypothetical protein
MNDRHAVWERAFSARATACSPVPDLCRSKVGYSRPVFKGGPGSWFGARLADARLSDRAVAEIVTARPRETCDQTETDRVLGDDEDDGDCRGCCFRRAFAVVGLR